MKKLALIALTFITIQVTAQERQREAHYQDGKMRMHEMIDLSPEEAATLQTKKMTLHLDLTKAQQAKVQELNLEQAKQRKAKMEARKASREDDSYQKPSKEERLKMMNERLDNQIARKEKMKAILNAEQYEKWSAKSERIHAKKRGHKKHMKQH